MDWSNEIIKVLDSLGQRFGVMIDWTQENIVPYIIQLQNKIVTYKLFMGIFGVAVSALFILFTIICVLKMNKNKDLFDREVIYYYSTRFVNGFRAVLAIVLIGVSIIIMTPIFLASIIAITQCLTFPELIIFRFIQGL